MKSQILKIFRSPLNISRKEYYLRMSKFVKTGIVTRRQGKYVLTSFGKVIYELQLLLVEAIDMNLRTVDPLIPILLNGTKYQSRKMLSYSNIGLRVRKLIKVLKIGILVRMCKKHAYVTL